MPLSQLFYSLPLHPPVQLPLKYDHNMKFCIFIYHQWLVNYQVYNDFVTLFFPLFFMLSFKFSYLGMDALLKLIPLPIHLAALLCVIVNSMQYILVFMSYGFCLFSLLFEYPNY